MSLLRRHPNDPGHVFMHTLIVALVVWLLVASQPGALVVPL